MTHCSNHGFVSARALLGGLLLLASAPINGCVLIGLEPDEIDVAVEESGEGGVATAGNDSDTEADTGADTMDPGGDGDPGNTSDPTGTGDGDPTGTGDGDPGGTEGDTGQAALGCDELGPTELMIGDNPVAIADELSALEASCGAAGPEQVFAFSVEVESTVSFTLVNADFDGALYLVDTICEPLDEVACVPAPGPLIELLSAGVSYYVIVDSDAGGGAATLTVEVL